MPAITCPHPAPLASGSTLSFSPSWGLVWFLQGAGPWLQLHHPNFGSVGRPTRAAAQVGSITALNDNLVFCCVFLRGCMPDQTAFLGLHPIFILFITPSDKGCLSVRLIFFQDTVLFYALLSL